MKVILANPRGFCAGVNMAIDCVDEVLKVKGPPVYVYHEIVHNRHVVEEADRIKVRFKDGREYNAQLRGEDNELACAFELGTL